MTSEFKCDKILYSFASVVSNVFSPPILVPVMFLVMIFHLELPLKQFYENTIIIITPIVAILLFFLWLLKTGKISDWDINIRQQRFLLNGFSAGMGLILTILLYFFGNRELFNYILMIYVSFIIFSVITYFWKISGHIFGITWVVLLLIRVFAWWWILLLIPLVAWARICRKNHTFAQTAGAVVLDTGIYFIFKLLGVV